MDFVNKHKLPVSIGFDDLLSLEREMDPADPTRLRRYSARDMYRVADLVIIPAFWKASASPTWNHGLQIAPSSAEVFP